MKAHILRAWALGGTAMLVALVAGPGSKQVGAAETAMVIPRAKSAATSTQPTLAVAGVPRPNPTRAAAPAAMVLPEGVPRPGGPIPRRKPYQRPWAEGGPHPQLPVIPSGDREALRAVLSTIDNFQGERALALRDSLTDPIDRKIADWRLARSGDPAVSARFIADFMAAAPDWPSQALMVRRKEEAFANASPAAERVVETFGETPPETITGMLLLLDAYRALDREEDARELAKELWRSWRLDARLEKRLLGEHGDLLDDADHKARVDMLLYDERTRDALRTASRLDADQRKLVAAVVAVVRGTGRAAALLKAVPEALRDDPLYQFTQIRHLRRNGKPEQAIELMLRAPTDPAVLVDPDAWWVERRLNSREALDLERYRDAYTIASAHAATSPGKQAEAEFHAGWYALRFLDDPQQARRHFSAVEKIGTTPITRSRALYWLGRADEAAGDAAGAREHYRQAAVYKTAFYGQLAHEKLGNDRLGLATVPRPDALDRSGFSRNELVIAIHRLEAAGFGGLTPPFYRALGNSLQRPGEIALVAELAQDQDRHNTALVVGKLALARNLDVDFLAFPTSIIPSRARVDDVGRPIVYAIARQESAFNPDAVSTAGARGLLQLMPATAKETAQRAGLAYSHQRLTSDPAYNATLGAAFLNELLDTFNGSYILTFAAYNAGASRPIQWMKRFGDPRTQEVDVVDWIERIPFTETRNYVQRIMENLVVYRARFDKDRLQISKDLKRG